MVIKANGSRTRSLWLLLSLLLSVIALLIFTEFSLMFAVAFGVLSICLLIIAISIVKSSAVQNALLVLATFSFCFALGEVGAWFANMSGIQTTDTLEYSMD